MGNTTGGKKMGSVVSWLPQALVIAAALVVVGFIVSILSLRVTERYFSAALAASTLYAGEHLLLSAGVEGVGVARQRLGIVGNGDAGVGVAVVDGHDLHGDVPHFLRRQPPRFFHIGSIIHKMAAGSNRKWDETAKNTGFFCKKRLTGGGKCGIVGITCEWVFSFCALFRFERAEGDHPAGRQKGVPKRKPNLIRRCR